MPRARKLFLSASTNRVRSGMRRKVSYSDTFIVSIAQAPIAVPAFRPLVSAFEEGPMSKLPMPLSADELRDAVRHSRHYDAARLDRILGVDEERGVVEVQANTTWRTLAAHLLPGDAKASAARTTTPSVGESIARNAAGPDGRPAVTHVEAIALVMPEGELRRISRQSNPRLFALAVGGHGLFGVPYSITR